MIKEDQEKKIPSFEEMRPDKSHPGECIGGKPQRSLQADKEGVLQEAAQVQAEDAGGEPFFDYGGPVKRVEIGPNGRPLPGKMGSAGNRINPTIEQAAGQAAATGVSFIPLSKEETPEKNVHQRIDGMTDGQIRKLIQWAQGIPADEASFLQAEIDIDIADIENTLEGIRRCCDRLETLIEHEAPLPLVENEINLLRYRSLSILRQHDAFLLMKKQLLEKEASHGSECKTAAKG